MNDAIEKSQDAHKDLQFISKKLSQASQLRESVVNAQKICRDIESTIEGEVTQEFNDWAGAHKINILPLEPNCLSAVLDEYFAGTGVFKKVKSREDIPDAIINSSIMSLQRDKEIVLTVILKDGAFKSHLAKQEDIHTYDSVGEFISLENNAAKLEELDSHFEAIEEIKVYLSSSEFSEGLLAGLKRNTSDIEEIYIESDEISSTDKLDANTFGETINFPLAESIDGFTVGNIVWLTEGVFSIDVEFIAAATIDYCTDYGSYMCIEDDSERELHMTSMNGDGICDISEVRNVKLKGYVQLIILGDENIHTIKDNLNVIGEDDSPLQLNIEMEYADIL